MNIAVFASGSGSNAENLVNYFADKIASVSLIACNNPNAYVLERAKKLGVASYLFNKEALKSGEVSQYLKSKNIDLIVLAGFLWLVPENLVDAFDGKIINIHPALLPRHGGKGMYGDRVHQAVVDAGDTESGITIHYVNAHYDEGQIIFQARCPVLPTDTAQEVAHKVHQLEYQHYPAVVERIIRGL